MHEKHLCLLSLLALALGARAQEAMPAAAPAPAPTGKDVEELLTRLAGLPPAAWEARVKDLEAKIAEHGKQAEALRKQAAELAAKAAGEDAQAQALKAEIDRVRALMALAKPKEAEPKAPAPPASSPMPAPAMPAPKDAVEDAPLSTFADSVLAIVQDHCVTCHDPEDQKGGLDLTSYRTLLAGGGSGKTIVPGDPEASRLYRLIARLETPYMPKDSDPLPQAKVELVRAWIAAGAPEDRKAALALLAQAAAKPEPVLTALTPRDDGAPPMPHSLPAVELAPAVNPPAVKAIAASPRAPLLALSGAGQVLLVHAESSVLLGVLPFAPGAVEVLRFTADGARLLAAGGQAGQTGAAVLFDVPSGAKIIEYPGDRDAVLAAAISPGQTLVALGGASKKVRVLAARSAAPVYEVAGHSDWITAVEFSADGNWLATADRGGTLCVWEADTGRSVHTLRPNAGAIAAVRFRPDAKALAAAFEDGSVRVFELVDGKPLWSKPLGGQALALAWSARHDLAAAGSAGVVKVWKESGADRGASPALGEWVYALAFDAAGERLWAGDWAGRLRLLGADAKDVKGVAVPAVVQTSS